MVSSFLYPRTIAIKRPATPPKAVFGTVVYQGIQPATETTVLQGISASIQFDRIGRSNPDDMPATSKLGYYRIMIPGPSAALGSILKNDIVVDDLGIRYQIEEPVWTSLGHELIGQIVVS